MISLLKDTTYRGITRPFVKAGGVYLPAVRACKKVEGVYRDWWRLALAGAGAVLLPGVTVAGVGQVLAVPTISINFPSSGEAYIFDGDMIPNSLSGYADGRGEALGAVTYTFSGATSGSGSASGTTTWSISSLPLNYGNTTVQVQVATANGTAQDSIVLGRTPTLVQAGEIISGFGAGAWGYVEGHTGGVSYRMTQSYSDVETGSCSVGTTVNKPGGGTYTAPAGCSAWATPLVSFMQVPSASYPVGAFITASNAAGDNANGYIIP